MPGSLSLSIGEVRLQVPYDDQLTELADMASRPGNVLPAGKEHFVSWLADRDPAAIRRELVAAVRQHRDLTAGTGWTLDLAVFVIDDLVGMQTLAGFDRWPRRRVVGTSAWLAGPRQRRGVGTCARAAVLDLAFSALGAQAAMSWALPANTASTAVSERLGYCVERTAARGGEAKYRLDAQRWRDHRPSNLPRTMIVGAHDLVDLIGPDS